MAARKPTFIDVVISVLAALFGVQSDNNRQRDFSQGHFWAYVVVGVVAIIIFVLALLALVRTIVP